MKEYTVSEAAQMLIKFGVIRRKDVNKNANGPTKNNNGETQVRLWIRTYDDTYEKEYKNKVIEGCNTEEAKTYAHRLARLRGIKASIKSRKEGYQIQEKDLEDFIAYKTNNSLNYENLSRELLNFCENAMIKTEENIDKKSWELGFKEAVELMQNYFSIK